MNIWKRSLDEIAADKLLDAGIDLFPGVPARFSAGDAVYILNVSEQTVQRMIEKGDLVPDIDGRFSKADLVRYVQTHALADVPVLED